MDSKVGDGFIDLGLDWNHRGNEATISMSGWSNMPHIILHMGRLERYLNRRLANAKHVLRNLKWV